MTDGNRKKLIIFIVIVVFSVLLCCLLMFFSDKSENKIACIYSEGKLLYSIDLSDENKEFMIETGNGYNIVCIRDGKIGIVEADCPDKTCIKTGFTDSTFIPVICMPHRLEIVIKGDAVETDGVCR